MSVPHFNARRHLSNCNPDSNTRTEILPDDDPYMAHIGSGWDILGYSSPCRVDHSNKEDSEVLYFRTGEEEATLNRVCDAGNVWGDLGGLDETDSETSLRSSPASHYETPKSPVNTKKKLLAARHIETVRLHRAFVSRLGGSDSGPSSPTYDPWNRGYANRFCQELHATVWAKPSKRKFVEVSMEEDMPSCFGLD
ncbi:hypothetical protein T484DRAFT_1756123 [Baffinella frigidus]|nr:hypothetical protein T484DRAFT_1756123 [Cryptophyta sp. CCMP2293]